MVYQYHNRGVDSVAAGPYAIRNAEKWGASFTQCKVLPQLFWLNTVQGCTEEEGFELAFSREVIQLHNHTLSPELSYIGHLVVVAVSSYFAIG